jgi:chromosome segregation ATPase
MTEEDTLIQNMTEEDTLIQNIIGQIKAIKNIEVANKGFVREIKTEVENLKPLVDQLLNKIVLNITSLNGELDKYNELNDKYNNLVNDTNELKKLVSEAIQEKDEMIIRQTDTGNEASKEKEILLEQINSLNKKIDTLENEKAALNTEKETLNSRIQKLNEGLKQIQIQLEDLNNNVIQSSELTDILKKIKEFTSYVGQIDINTLFDKKKLTGRGGRRRHGRKHSTKKMKKGMKKGMMMRGGFIAEYNFKPKTYRRRRNNKKRSSSTKSSRKNSSSTITSRMKTTSSY